jgi:hypothetical protein
MFVSDTLPGLMVLAIGGSIVPPLVLLTILFLGIVALMLVLVVFAIPVLALIGLYAAFPHRASTMLGSLQRWMGDNNRTFTVVLCFVFGAFFLVRGLSGA